jgi:hypothetical protein
VPVQVPRPVRGLTDLAAASSSSAAGTAGPCPSLERSMVDVSMRLDTADLDRNLAVAQASADDLDFIVLYAIRLDLR